MFAVAFSSRPRHAAGFTQGSRRDIACPCGVPGNDVVYEMQRYAKRAHVIRSTAGSNVPLLINRLFIYYYSCPLPATLLLARSAFPVRRRRTSPAQKKRPPCGGLMAVKVSALDEIFGEGNDASDQLFKLFSHALGVLAGAL